MVLSCNAMDTEKTTKEERFQVVLIHNLSQRPIKMYSELMFRQTWLPTKQEPLYEEPKNFTARSLTYLMSLWSSKPTVTTAPMDGNSEEPRGILEPNETTEFTLLLNRTRQQDSSFIFRKKAFINLYHPTDMKMSMDSKLASCTLGKEPIESYIITENTDEALVINKINITVTV